LVLSFFQELPVPDEPVWLEPLQRVGLALTIGFLVGVERGWKQRDDGDGQRVAGIRTFALIGLLGGVCGLLLPTVGAAPVAAMALAFGTAFAAFQFRQAVKDGDNSVTSTVAGLLVLALGLYAVVGETVVAAAVAVAGTIVLAFKEGLHTWVRSITWKEMRSALLILAATCIALPLMPEGAVDPWGAIEPRSLWLITILIASASFVGYVALRALGQRAGLMVGALAGAIVSSTVVTIDLGRRVRSAELDASSGAAAAALAAAVSLIRCGAVASLFSSAVAAHLLPALTASAAVCLGCAWFLARPAASSVATAPYPAIKSPLDLWSVARFAVVLVVLTIGANLISRGLGSYGFGVFAATAGLVDVDAVTLAVGRLTMSGLATEAAVGAILIGILANQVFKLAAVAFGGALGFSLRFGAVVTLASIAGAIAHALTPLVYSSLSMVR
jgi:uncharacterized membrane protein (DUF4010 family)